MFEYSVKAVTDEYAAAVTMEDNTVTGYGLININNGGIPQLAVSKKYRGNGIGSYILDALGNYTGAEKITFLNINKKYEGMQAFLVNAGFQNYVEQYEMLLKLE